MRAFMISLAPSGGILKRYRQSDISSPISLLNYVVYNTKYVI